MHITRELKWIAFGILDLLLAVACFSMSGPAGLVSGAICTASAIYMFVDFD